MELLTIFTPTYNRAHTLPRVYESLCRQTCQDFRWLVIDDGSTDNTENLIKGYISDSPFKIDYIKKENGGLYTGYNTAYANIETELNVCIDSDDFMPDDAVEIISETWEKHGSDKYAGIIGLDFLINGNPIGGYFPTTIHECRFYDLYEQAIHFGDTKPVYRSELTSKVAPIIGYDNEKNFNPVYFSMKIDQLLPMLLLNKCLCIVEYQEVDSMSKNIFNQYFNSPKSFSKMRLMEMKIAKKWKNLIRINIHYVATSIISRDKKFITNSPKPFLTLLATLPGLLLFFYFKFKASK